MAVPARLAAAPNVPLYGVSHAVENVHPRASRLEPMAQRVSLVPFAGIVKPGLLAYPLADARDCAFSSVGGRIGLWWSRGGTLAAIEQWSAPARGHERKESALDNGGVQRHVALRLGVL